MQKDSILLLRAGASKNFDGSGFSSGSTQYQNLAPTPAPPKLAGSMAPGSGSGSPALLTTPNEFDALDLDQRFLTFFLLSPSLAIFFYLSPP